MEAEQPIDVAVVGVGRMGRHHARIYAGLAGARLTAVVDADADRAATVADEYGCESFSSVEALLEAHPSLAAASVAVPTPLHASAAAPLLKRKVACLIEKPLAPTVAEARDLAHVAQRSGAVLQVGHTERFNPAVRAVAAMKLTPRFMEVDRVSPMTFRSLDVGVVMDMMIHDLDVVMMLARSPIRNIESTGVAVLGEHEDVANARVVFANGCVANLSASRLALKTERKLRVFSESAYVSLDYQSRGGVVIRKSDNEAALDRLREQLRAGADLSGVDYSAVVQVQELTMDPSDTAGGADGLDPLTAELTSFLGAARRGGAPAVDAAAGFAAVEAAEQVVAGIRQHRWEGRTGTRL